MKEAHSARLRFFLVYNSIFQTGACVVGAPFATHIVRHALVGFDIVFFILTMFLEVTTLNLFIYLVLRSRPESFQKWIVLPLEIAWLFVHAVSFALFAYLGIHLDHPVVSEWYHLSGANLDVKPPLWALALILSLLVAISVFEWQLWAGTGLAARGWIEEKCRFTNLRRVGILYLVAVIFVSFVVLEGDRGSTPFQAIFGSTWIARAFAAPVVASLRPEFLKFSPAPLQRRPDIVMVLAESFRWSEVSERQTPNLFSLLSRPDCSPSARHYSGGHITSYGGFTFLNGMESYLFKPFVEAHQPSRALATLRFNGYRLSAFDASGLLRFNPPVVAKNDFDTYQDFLNHSPTGGEDEQLLQAFLKDWEARDSNRPQMSFLFFYSTHHPYTFPASEELDPGPAKKSNFERYHSSVHWIDSLVGRIRARLTPETVFVFAGDHGEAFGEFGTGHVGVRFEDVRTRVPLVLCLPGRSYPKAEMSAHADIFPTIFDALGAPRDWRTKSFTGKSLLDASQTRKFVPITGAFYPTEGRDLALAVSEGKILLKATGTSPASLHVEGQLDTGDQPTRTTIPDEQKTVDDFMAELKKAFY